MTIPDLSFRPHQCLSRSLVNKNKTENKKRAKEKETIEEDETVIVQAGAGMTVMNLTKISTT